MGVSFNPDDDEYDDNLDKNADADGGPLPWSTGYPLGRVLVCG